MNDDREKILARLRRIEGQIRGLQRMIEREAPCPEILTQVSAVTAAIKKTGMAIIQAHMEECLTGDGKKSGNRKVSGVADFKRALSRYIDLA
jgi:DNA-binding FrmR family transcriptional regulator